MSACVSLMRQWARQGDRRFFVRCIGWIAGMTLPLVALGCRNSASPVDGARHQVIWRVPVSQVGGGWHGTPAIVGNRVFFELNNGVTAFDVGTGAVLWQSAVKPNASPAAENIVARGGRLFLAEAVEVLGLDAATGAILWRFTPDAQAAESESAVDDVAMYIGTRTHKVYALDVRTGTALWTTDIGPTWSYPGFIKGMSVSGDTVYAGGVRYLNQFGGISAGVIAALDRRDGHVLWMYQGPGNGQFSVNSAPTVAGRLLVASDLGGAFVAVDRMTGQEVWRVNGTIGYFGPHAAPVVVGSQVYVGSNDKSVYRADLATGSVVWKTDTRGSIGTFTVCNQTAFANNQRLFALDTSSGQVVSTLLVDSGEDFLTSGFAVAPDRVLVSGSQAVYAIGC